MAEKTRINAAELGQCLWRVPMAGSLINHDFLGEVLRYDDASRPNSPRHKASHEFVRDLLRAFAKTEDIVEKWKDAVLVLSDGTEEPMSPQAMILSVAAFREKK